MPDIGLTDQERDAAEILAALLGAKWVARDVQGVNDVHDFDLEFPDGKRFAVEVVSDTSETDASFWKQIDRINRMPTEGRHGWQVDLYTPGRHARDTLVATRTVKRLMNELSDLLKQLEDADPIPFENNHFYVGRGPRYGEHPLAAPLRELGIQSVSKKDHYVTAEGRPYLLFGQTISSSWFDKSDIVDAANDALDKKRSRIEKAKHTDADEVHLFIWLILGQEHNNNTPGLWAAEMFGFDSNDPVPDLGEADKVWLAGRGCREDGSLTWDIWSYSRPERWVRHRAGGAPPLTP